MRSIFRAVFSQAPPVVVAPLSLAFVPSGPVCGRLPTAGRPLRPGIGGLVGRSEHAAWVWCIAVLGMVPWAVQAQVEPLTLRSLLTSTAASNPSLWATRLEAQASTQDVDVAERQRWPTLSVTAESKTATAASPPLRNIRVEQTLWDAGRVQGGIAESKALAQISQINVDLQRQELSLQIVAGWQALAGSIARISVAKEALRRLEGFEMQMQRRVQAKASPIIDLELVSARLLQTSVELLSAQSSLRGALVRLEQLSGRQGLAQQVPTIEAPPSVQATQPFADALTNMDLRLVAVDSDSAAKARTEGVLAQARLETRQANQWPQVYARLDLPMGRPPGGNSGRPIAFIGLSYTPGAGLSNLAQAQAQATRVQSQEQTLSAAIRLMEEALQNDREEFDNSRARVIALGQASQGAVLVLESFERQFQAGRKTWVDLLNAVRDLAQNQYAQADTQTAMAGAMHRLEIRLDRTNRLP